MWCIITITNPAQSAPTFGSEALKKLLNVVKSMGKCLLEIGKPFVMPALSLGRVNGAVGEGYIYSRCNATHPLVALGSKVWQPVRIEG